MQSIYRVKDGELKQASASRLPDGWHLSPRLAWRTEAERCRQRAEEATRESAYFEQLSQAALTEAEKLETE